MKGKEIINHIVRAKMPDREQVKERIIMQSLPEKRTTSRQVYRSPAENQQTATALA